MNETFKGPLATELAAFLEYKRARGYKYGTKTAKDLVDFDTFVGREAPTRPMSLEKVIAGWLLSRAAVCSRATLAAKLGVLRQFCIYLRRHDPETFVPEQGWLPYRRRYGGFRPYIFSSEEVVRILHEARKLRPMFRGLTMHTIILVLYCTGLRPGEVVRLRLSDVHVDSRTLFVRDSKHRSRWVPFHAELARRLRGYVFERKYMAPTTPEASFFTSPTGDEYSSMATGRMFTAVADRLGIATPAGRAPRLYDFRHTYAVHNLQQWYSEGLDISQRLTLLSAYMGHKKLTDTEVYLTATPELLQMASNRFRERFEAAGSA